MIPEFSPRPWGTRDLRPIYTRVVGKEPIGEAWLTGDECRVANGPFSGASLSELCRRFGRELIGQAAPQPDRFPLLMKFLFPHDKLSVQVHPDDEGARELGQPCGKTECWYIVDAKENAEVIVGFRENVTRRRIIEKIEKSCLDELLNCIPVKKGDLLHIPAGTVHAITEGTLLYEVQETSDATLRLYDWGRLDHKGNPRPLHVRDALTVLDMTAQSRYHVTPVVFDEPGYRHAIRMACRYFALEEYTFLRDREVILPAKQSFRVLSLMSGSLTIQYPDGCARLSAGDTMLLPALLREVRATGTKGSTLLVTSVPDIHAEIVSPLSQKGISAGSIALLGGNRNGKNDLLKYL